MMRIISLLHRLDIPLLCQTTILQGGINRLAVPECSFP
jgi:hypothetical protein